MDRKYIALLACLLTALVVQAGPSLTDDEILQQILQKAKENEDFTTRVGFHQTTATKKMKDGKISEEKIRFHRLTWIDNRPYLELLRVDGRELNPKEKKEEAERRAKFIKSLGKQDEEEDDDDEDVTWDDMARKYNFQRLPADSTGAYVFSFHPKPGKLSEGSRTEKVLNHVAGKFWADQNFNIVRAEAKLLDNVRFGLGILGNVEKLEMIFKQTDFDRMKVPAYFYVHFKARVALVKVEERQIESRYQDFFYRESVQAAGK
jgi:hypothetical protein